MFTCGLLRSNFSLLIFVSIPSLCQRLQSGVLANDSTQSQTGVCATPLVEPAMRFELMTSSLPRRRSTPELRGRDVRQALACLFAGSESQPIRTSDNLSRTNLERATRFE